MYELDQDFEYEVAGTVANSKIEYNGVANFSQPKYKLGSVTFDEELQPLILRDFENNFDRRQIDEQRFDQHG